MLFFIVGKTASGKDAIAKYLSKRFDIPVIVSHTTRPKRAYETNGKEHWFNTPEEMSKIVSSGNVIAYTKFPVTGYEYCATADDIPRGKDAIYIINPDGVKWYNEHSNGTIPTKTIYVYVTENRIVARAKARGDDPETIKKRLDSEREEMDAFYHNCEYDIAIDNNGYLEDALEEASAYVYSSLRFRNSSKKKSFEVDVRGGQLIAEASTDPDNPGIYISYRPNGETAEVNLLLAENTDPELRVDGADPKDIRVLVWKNPAKEDYTDELIFSGSETKKILTEDR